MWRVSGAKGLIYAVISQNSFSGSTDSTLSCFKEHAVHIHVNCVYFFFLCVISNIYYGHRVDDTLTQEL